MTKKDKEFKYDLIDVLKKHFPERDFDEIIFIASEKDRMDFLASRFDARDLKFVSALEYIKTQILHNIMIKESF